MDLGWFVVHISRGHRLEFSINPLKTRETKTGTFANNEDPDEMLHYAAFHQCLHCMPRKNIQRK